MCDFVLNFNGEHHGALIKIICLYVGGGGGGAMPWRGLSDRFNKSINYFLLYGMA